MFIKTILSICPRILQYNAEEKPQETTRWSWVTCSKQWIDFFVFISQCFLV